MKVLCYYCGMLTDKQKKWLEHLSDSDITEIISFDPQAKKDFLELKKELEKVLGKDVDITLRGSTSLGISGKGELDVYIPVPLNKFDYYLQKLIKAYGKPGSLYPNERSRFNRYINGTKAEVFLINEEVDGWLQLNVFEDWLKNHPEDLKEYEELKASLKGKSGREYYTEKTAYFNSIIDKASKDKTEHVK